MVSFYHEHCESHDFISLYSAAQRYCTEIDVPPVFKGPREICTFSAIFANQIAFLQRQGSQILIPNMSLGFTSMQLCPNYKSAKVWNKSNAQISAHFADPRVSSPLNSHAHTVICKGMTPTLLLYVYKTRLSSMSMSNQLALLIPKRPMRRKQPQLVAGEVTLQVHRVVHIHFSYTSPEWWYHWSHTSHGHDWLI